MEDSIFDQLRSLGVHIGTGKIPARNGREKKIPIEQVVSGDNIINDFGESFLHQNEYITGYRHGNVNLSDIGSQMFLSHCLQMPELNEITREEIIYLDTETSGLSGGAGTFVFLVGLGYFRDEKFHVEQIFLKDPGQEEAFLHELAELVDGYRLVVTFNGKSFDIPMLNNRFTLNRIPTAFSDFQHVDLLHISRKLWKNRLPSRTLGMLENEIIGFFRGEDEVPGWMVPEIYLDYLHTEDATPLKGIFYHNEMDILSLAVLHGYINRLVESPIEQAAEQVLDLVAIARIYEQSGQIDRAIDLYQYSMKHSMPEEIYIESLKRYALIYKRRGEWDRALELWHILSKYRQYDSCIEIAKYYEHREKNYSAAIEWTEKAELDSKSTKMWPYERERVKRNIEQRLNRLRRKN